MIGGKGLEPGDAFFGHFIVKDGDMLVAEQTPSANALMIEAFAFDAAKKAFNFYELRGDGPASGSPNAKSGSSSWFYRGDSHDIASDVARVHASAKADYGERLRCSGCHMHGAAIMKELAPPHNDWWTPTRGLDFGGRTFEPRLQTIIATLQPPETLARATQASLARIVHKTSLVERARPLFCPIEVNLESDSAEADTIQIPSAFFLDPRLATGEVLISRKAYDEALAKTDTKFPETTLRDSAHAWLTPVKAYSDIAAINALVAEGALTEAFVMDVLAVDMTNPVFSPKRCALLHTDWTKIPHKPIKEHQASAKAYIAKCKNVRVEEAYAVLLQRRAEVRASQISQNPKGQILEPGFRVIFPESPKQPAPGALTFDQTCRISRSARTRP